MRKRRGHKRLLPLDQRAYYTREEVCRHFGFSASRLLEIIANDDTLPMLKNGRNQLFPKDGFGAWFEAAAKRRQQFHDTPKPRRIA
jgi:hypothetical protein